MAIGVGSTAIAVGGIQVASGEIDLVAMLPALGAAAIGSLAPDLDHPWSLASATIPVTLISYAVAFLGLRAYEAAHPEAMFRIASALGPSGSLAAWVSLGIGLTLLVLSFVFARMFGHRGIVHSFAFGLGATLLSFFGLALFRAPVWLAVPFLWGWSAHLLADATTPAGLSEMLWPLGRASV